MALTAIRIPEWVHFQAVKILLQFRQQRISPRRMRRTGYLSLKEAAFTRWRPELGSYES